MCVAESSRVVDTDGEPSETDGKVKRVEDSSALLVADEVRPTEALDDCDAAVRERRLLPE